MQHHLKADHNGEWSFGDIKPCPICSRMVKNRFVIDYEFYRWTGWGQKWGHMSLDTCSNCCCCCYHYHHYYYNYYYYYYYYYYHYY